MERSPSLRFGDEFQKAAETSMRNLSKLLGKGGVQRPQVYIRLPKEGTIFPLPMKSGVDVFLAAGVNTKEPKVCVEQLDDGSIVVYTKRAPNVGGGEDDDDDDNKPLPAGSYTVRKDYIGCISRFAVRSSGYWITKPKQVRVAAVVVPIIRIGTGPGAREYLLLTQRKHKKNGTYNDLWVFPGGHVEYGETLEEGGARELYEETGLLVDAKHCTKLCVWQEFLIPALVTYIMMVFYTIVEYPDMNEDQFLDVLSPQPNEVHACALMPRSTWKQLGHKLPNAKDVTHHNSLRFEGKIPLLIDGFIKDEENEELASSSIRREEAGELVAGLIEEDGEFIRTGFGVNEIYGHGRLKGIGGGHRFAAQQLVRELQIS